MRSFRFGPTIAGALASMAGAPVLAQSSPRFGPPVEGVCLFARAEALETSRQGREIARRIDAARALVQNQVASEQHRIQAELDGLPPSQSSRRIKLFEEMNTVNSFAANADKRIEQQSRIAFRAIEPAMKTALATVVSHRRCGMIVERSITYGWNSAMDITSLVIEAMDTGSGAPDR